MTIGACLILTLLLGSACVWSLAVDTSNAPNVIRSFRDVALKVKIRLFPHTAPERPNSRHQPIHGAARRRDTLEAQLPPEFADAVDTEGSAWTRRADRGRRRAAW